MHLSLNGQRGNDLRDMAQRWIPAEIATHTPFSVNDVTLCSSNSFLETRQLSTSRSNVKQTAQRAPGITQPGYQDTDKPVVSPDPAIMDPKRLNCTRKEVENATSAQNI